jgi:hypothetical protein
MKKKTAPLNPVDFTPKFFEFESFKISTLESAFIDYDLEEEISYFIDQINDNPPKSEEHTTAKKALKKKLNKFGIKFHNFNQLVEDRDNFLKSIVEVVNDARIQAMNQSFVDKITAYFEMEARIEAGEIKEGDQKMKVLKSSIYNLRLQDGSHAHVYAHSKEHYDSIKH